LHAAATALLLHIAVILHSRLITHGTVSASPLAMFKQTCALKVALSDTLNSANSLIVDVKCAAIAIGRGIACMWGINLLMHCAVEDSVCSFHWNRRT